MRSEQLMKTRVLHWFRSLKLMLITTLKKQLPGQERIKSDQNQILMAILLLRQKVFSEALNIKKSKRKRLLIL